MGQKSKTQLVLQGGWRTISKKTELLGLASPGT